MENNLFVSTILPICLAIIMFGMGSTLVRDDFKRILAQPKAVAVGVLGQMVLLPLSGLMCVYLFNLPSADAVGLMILVACAGGPMSNLISYLVRADVALSVTLTAVSCCATIFTIPLIVNFALHNFANTSEQHALPLAETNLKLFIVTVLPLILGMWLRHLSPSTAYKLETPLKRIGTAFFLFIVLAIVIKERHNLAAVFASLGPAAYALNVAMMLLGFSLARMFKLNNAQSTTISIEIGLQNSATGIFIAAGLLANPAFAVMPAVYAICMMVNVAILLGILTWKQREPLPA